MTGWGVLNLRQFVDHLRELIAIAPDVFVFCDTVHLLTEQGSVGHYRSVGTMPEGGEFELAFELFAVHREGRIARLEMFPDGEVDEALSRFRECVSAPIA